MSGRAAAYADDGIGQTRDDPESISACLKCPLPQWMCEGLGNPSTCRAAYEVKKRPLRRNVDTCEWRYIRKNDDGVSMLRVLMDERSLSVTKVRDGTGIPYDTVLSMAFSPMNANKTERVELGRARLLADFLGVPLGRLVETEEGDE